AETRSSNWSLSLMIRELTLLPVVAPILAWHEHMAMRQVTAVHVQRDRRQVLERIAEHVVIGGRNQRTRRAHAGARTSALGKAVGAVLDVEQIELRHLHHADDDAFDTHEAT